MKYLDYFLTPIFYVLAFKIAGIIEFEFPNIIYFYLIAIVVHFFVKNAFIQIVKLIKTIRN